MSHLATWQGNPRIGVDHAVAAQGWAKRSDDVLLDTEAVMRLDERLDAYGLRSSGRT